MGRCDIILFGYSKGLDKAIEETQNFFMKIIKAILQPNQNYLCEKSNKNLALNFLHEAEKIENNALAGDLQNTMPTLLD